MSQLLDLLLDPERQRQCAEHDQILNHQPKGEAMKHRAIHVGRVFADMESTSEPEEGAEYDITVIRFGRPEEHGRQWFPSPSEADTAASALSFGGAVVMLRPAAQMGSTL